MGLAPSPLSEILERVHGELCTIGDGQLADYIPELGRADPRLFGIAVATTDGDVFSVGDADAEFTIQSISKPLVFGMALEELGSDEVLGHVGVEPSGNPFNAVTVEERTGRPYNPMVNSGAIVTTALVGGNRPGERLRRIAEKLGAFAGRTLDLDERVHASEAETGDRNRALAWLMRSFGMLDGDVHDVVDSYFGQCSVLVTCRDLAVIGATLANGGTNPKTGAEVLSPRHVANVLSVMTTCGMYDNAGEWVYNVGLPAKSGVSGGVLAVLPGQFGIGVFSPLLDGYGNSVRGVQACERLSEDLRLHLLRPHIGLGSVVRRAVRGDERASHRVRSAAEELAILEGRGSIMVYELQGELFFASVERVHRAVIANAEDVQFVVLDFTHATGVDEPGVDALDELVGALTASGRAVVVVDIERDTGIAKRLTAPVVAFVECDAALEWCEDRLLEASPHGRDGRSEASLEEFELFDGLDTVVRDAIAATMDVTTIDAGTTVFREGDPADAVFLLLSGTVSVFLPLGAATNGRRRRLASIGPGVVFGESALIDDGHRSADVVCEERSTVGSLSHEALRELDAAYPGLLQTIQRNLARLLARRLHSANAQIRALAR